MNYKMYTMIFTDMLGHFNQYTEIQQRYLPRHHSVVTPFTTQALWDVPHRNYGVENCYDMKTEQF